VSPSAGDTTVKNRRINRLDRMLNVLLDLNNHLRSRWLAFSAMNRNGKRTTGLLLLNLQSHHSGIREARIICSVSEGCQVVLGI
jgi:hypothetical protein